MKELYEFSENGNSCIIKTPSPPRHWYNYLWNEDRYCVQVSQSGQGRSYYLSEKAEMCQINSDNARYVFLRDDDKNDAWNIGFSPLNTPVEDYGCTHSIGHSLLQSVYKGIAASWRIFVPKSGFHEVWTLTLENKGDTARNISVFSAVSFSLEGFSYPRYYEMYRCMNTKYDSELSGIYCASAHPFAPHRRYNGFLSSNEPAFAYDGDLTAFCGSENTQTMPDASTSALFSRPDIAVNGKDCTNSQAALFILGGVLQHKITLAPKEKKQLQILFGIAEGPEEARRVTRQYKDPVLADRQLSEAEEYYFQKYGSLNIRTPDTKINFIMNNWLKKQADFCIVGKKGVRDNLQIAAALLDYRQDKAREEILECLRHQFKDGHGVLTWYPYDDTRYSDQPFWIIWAACRLIKETGDFSVLDESIEWQDGGEASVLEHIKAAVDRLIADKGRNGLVKIYFADWNDALNITTDPEAESVMLSEQFCLALKELAELLKHYGDSAYSKRLVYEYEMLKKALNERAWDGSWYMRALSAKENIGSINSSGSKIYLNSQVWAVLADICDGARLDTVLNSIDRMEHDFGFPLNLPPYREYSPNVGRMSGMLPGLFENGGVYCHATGFKILMDCKTGRGDKALETLKKIMPDSDKNPSSRSGAEPYVFTNCYSTNPDYYGKSYQSWTTGTSAWCLMGLYEGIMGVRADYKGLMIDPCFPSSWDKAEMTRHFRGADYHIVIKNCGKGKKLRVDGKEAASNIIPDFGDGKIHEVEVLV
ncbi:MAG: cellobiose phosphorylase [Firmicutes bacterium]|nr:cellobiose phosphorylase [[Eubacterium] siraeum]MCM1488670.1 cellobiose phosphorylase [Bacillota bacterium]